MSHANEMLRLSAVSPNLEGCRDSVSFIFLPREGIFYTYPRFCIDMRRTSPNREVINRTIPPIWIQATQARLERGADRGTAPDEGGRWREEKQWHSLGILLFLVALRLSTTMSGRCERYGNWMFPTCDRSPTLNAGVTSGSFCFCLIAYIHSWPLR